MSLLIEAKDLSVSIRQFKTTVKAVEGVSFQIKRGEVYCLVGESGCGKTLTGLSILRLLPPNIDLSGSIVFYKDTHPLDLTKLSETELRQIRGKEIGIIFQEPMTSLNPVFTIQDQIIEPILTHERVSKAEAIQRALELLKRMGFKEPEKTLKRYPHQLSGGMRQRVMLCMAIICNPGLLIADEPTTALDVTIQAEIMQLLKQIQHQRGLSILLISHNLALVYEIAHRVAIMYAGSIVEEAPTEELFDNPLHPYTRGLIGSLPTGKGTPLRPIPGSVPSPGQWPSGCRFGPRCLYRKEICIRQYPAMESATPGHLVSCHRWREI